LYYFSQLWRKLSEIAQKWRMGSAALIAVVNPSSLLAAPLQALAPVVAAAADAPTLPFAAQQESG
jgi:hypothetical protein